MLIGFHKCTNNSTELLAAKHLIQFALEKNFTDLQLFGDSKIICDWLNRKTRCSTYTLLHILDETLRLISYFDTFTCSHNYREQNGATDSLSKEVAIGESGFWMIKEQNGEAFYQYYHQPFMELDV